MKRKQMKKTKKAVSKKVDNLPFGIGDAIMIRTVTMIQAGRVTNIGPDSVTLEDASWIACTKRLSVTLATGDVEEAEECPGWVCVGRGAIVDVFPWSHSLPVRTK